MPALPLENPADGVFVHRGTIARPDPDNGSEIALLAVLEEDGEQQPAPVIGLWRSIR